MNYGLQRASVQPDTGDAESGTVHPRRDDTGNRPTDGVITRRFALSAERRLATLEREMRAMSGDVVELENEVKALRSLVRQMREARS